MASAAFQADDSFRAKMRPAAVSIYRRIWPGCVVEDLTRQGGNVHVLDQEFAVDAKIILPGGHWFTLQEKYRRNNALRWLDFTQEYKNAVGTQYEQPGEWFKLASQLYFYGWADKDEKQFEKWAIIDVARYKHLVESLGGLHKIGKLNHNNTHGRASFFAIPIKVLEPAFLFDYRQFRETP